MIDEAKFQTEYSDKQEFPKDIQDNIKCCGNKCEQY
jgi:hypothetical protein